MKRPVRIANASGFLGDREAALREMVEGGDVDVVTGDYLAELTMLVLGKQRLRDPEAGYAAAFLRHVGPVLGTVLQRGIRVVVNAGGLNPAGLTAAVRALAAKQGLAPAVATVDGDDLLPRIDQLRGGLASLESGAALPAGPVLTANAYLGAWGIVKALEAGAEIVICGRVTDASLAVGPAAWWHAWSRENWDAIAGAIVAGHVIECGAQATGGNYAGFRGIDLRHPGFPIAEVAADGSCVVTKHPGTGGAVTAGTVTAQLVYEIGGPRYLNPDATVLLEDVRVTDLGSDRVQVNGARGAPPPPTTKVALTIAGGYRNELTFVLTGVDGDDKAAVLERAARAALASLPLELDFQRIGAADPAAAHQDGASSLLRIVATSVDEVAAGRTFSSRLVELALASYPGLFTTDLPGPATAIGRYWPALVLQTTPEHAVTLPDGLRASVPAPPVMAAPPPDPNPVPSPPAPGGPQRLVPLAAIARTRSGDKGSDANVGVWVETDAAWSWLRADLDVARFRQLVPEAAPLAVDRFELPGLRAVVFVVHGLLAGGAAATVRFDRQGKALGEHLRARHVLVPASLLGEVTMKAGPELVHRADAGGVATLTLDSPANRNALSPELLEQLHAHLRDASRDPETRAIVLTATGTVFCSGADVSGVRDAAGLTSMVERNAALLAELMEVPVPVIVSVNGSVRGGGLGLLGAADIVVAPDDASFAFSEVRIGAVPATIAAVLLPRLEPRAVQRYMLTGETFDVAEAVRIGLVSSAVPAADVASTVDAILAALRLSSPAAVRTTKTLLADLRTRSIRDGLVHAADVSAKAFASDDAREGIAAFLGKRPPRWTGGET